jgi:ubiquitin-conjugating enzyme E2 variant
MRAPQAPRAADRSAALAAVELLALVACAAGFAVLILRGIRSFDGIASGLIAVAAAFLGYLAADVATGLVHWFCDRFFEEHTPIVGPLLIQPFREHHRDPKAMTHHGALELCGNSALALAPVLAAAAVCRLGAFVDAAMVAFGAAALAANLFHCWAHAEHVPWVVAHLQSAHIILSPRGHARHHAGGHDAAYCVTSGWANRIVDRFAVFAHLERALVRLGLPATKAVPS